jgi:aspartate carbamoyltransferase catalytic subunit
VAKGETLLDTARTIEAMGVDIVVMRHGCSGAPALLAERLSMAVVNAGDGTHEHPTQGLLDVFTMRERFGSIQGLEVAVVGDILHSRVARSNIYALGKLGAKVRLVGPATLVPKEFRQLGVSIHHDLPSGLEGVHVVNILRIQLERQRSNLFPSLREYRLLYGITEERLKLAHPDVMVMHPGPINRGVEIDQSVADGPRSVIPTQVTNGIAVRMAVLFQLATQRPSLPEG